MDGWMDGWMDGLTKYPYHGQACPGGVPLANKRSPHTEDSCAVLTAITRGITWTFAVDESGEDSCTISATYIYIYISVAQIICRID